MHRDIGYLPEQPYFYDYLTAAEVLDYFARLPRLQRDRNAKKRVQRMLQEGGPGNRRENSAAEIFPKACCSESVWRRQLCMTPKAVDSGTSRCPDWIRWGAGKVRDIILEY